MAMMRVVSCLSFLVLSLHSSEAPVTTAPQGDAVMEAQRRSGPPQRSGPTFEVEVLTFSGTDPQSVAEWATLAAQGFRVVATIPQPDGTSVLCLERMAVPQRGGLRLPNVLNEHPAIAADLHHRLSVEQQQRQRPGNRPTAPLSIPSAPKAPAAPAETVRE